MALNWEASKSFEASQGFPFIAQRIQNCHD